MMSVSPGVVGACCTRLARGELRTRPLVFELTFSSASGFYIEVTLKKEPHKNNHRNNNKNPISHNCEYNAYTGNIFWDANDFYEQMKKWRE